MKISRQEKHPHNDMVPLERALVVPPKDDDPTTTRLGRVCLSNFGQVSRCRRVTFRKCSS